MLLVAPIVRYLARTPQETAGIIPEVVLELVDAVDAQLLG
jgi:hypothetical protein